jgi:L-seryl-tRNA(Ser) seleniumtransferase
LEARAQRLSASCRAARPELTFAAVRVRSAVGGGALPTCEPWSWAVAVSGARVEQLDARLRAGDPPVIGRIAEDRLLLDVRTLEDDDLAEVATRLRETIA